MRWSRYLKSFLNESNDLFILYIQYYSWRWLGDAKSYCINSHSTDLILLEYSSLRSRGMINTLRPKQNVRIFRPHFQMDFLQWKYLDYNSLKFVPKGSINYISSLVQIMAWCQTGDKPLSEPMMVISPMYISITCPHWVNWCLMMYTYMWTMSSLAQVMACPLFKTKPVHNTNQCWINKLTEAECRIYALVKHTITASDNGL